MSTTMAPSDLRDALTELAHAVRPEVPRLFTAREAARHLGIGDKLFRAEVRARRIRFVLIGARRKFTLDDLRAYIDSRRELAPCPSIGRKGRRTGTLISSSRVYDITAVLASRTKRKRAP